MPLPYRTLLRLPPQTDVIALAQQEMQSWLGEKIPRQYRSKLAKGEYFVPGAYTLGSSALRVARADRGEDDSQRLLMQFTETTRLGTWETTVVAIDYVANSRKEDALLVEVRRVDDPNADGQVDPPRVVRHLLERVQVLDGQAHVTAEPRLVRVEDVDEVFAAITDSHRSVSVIVAASFSRDVDDIFRARVKQLTSKVIGTAAVFFATEEAVKGLNSRLPSTHALEEGRVRTYLPDVDLADRADGRRHRTLGPATFARAIRGAGVADYLQAAFAVETRKALYARALPSDVRRSLDSVLTALRTVDRQVKIEQRTEAALAAPTVTVSRAQTSRPLERLKVLLKRWLGKDVVVSVQTVDDLDSFLATQAATAETLLEDAGELERDLASEKTRNEELRLDVENLELEAAETADEASALRRRVEYLQSKLAEAGEYNVYSSLPTEVDWEPPSSVAELATLLQFDGEAKHVAAERVEFTGSIDEVLEVVRRDQLGRYSNAMWEFVQVLYDYVGLKQSGDFTGSVHMYLSDDMVVGKKCSSSRHVPTESESVVNNPAWSAERIRPVPLSVHPEGRVAMLAHFRPTHRDTFAPRMHYYDDVENSGKVYIGYIGKHLTNKQT